MPKRKFAYLFFTTTLVSSTLAEHVAVTQDFSQVTNFIEGWILRHEQKKKLHYQKLYDFCMSYRDLLQHCKCNYELIICIVIINRFNALYFNWIVTHNFVTGPDKQSQSSSLFCLFWMMSTARFRPKCIGSSFGFETFWYPLHTWMTRNTPAIRWKLKGYKRCASKDEA